uniref:Tail specific protease domain-containing protein n=2 Tax=Schizophyllum commune (strain H4-8 / FGSC 9210) TaxID=578458 RepID=D8Q8U2_SCHCM
MGQECQPFDMDPPSEALFEPENVIIMSNGRCASSCSLFSITMAKAEGVRTLVYGGRTDTPQQYCGVVGGQSTDFSTIDSEIKSVKLKNHTLAPPDFLSNSIQGITWRLGYGIDDPKQPEEWQDHPAMINLPVSYELVNKPERLWQHVASVGFPAKHLSFVAQQPS